MNKFSILQNILLNKQINIPIELKWDYEGLDDAVDEYEIKSVKEVVGVGYDFEVNRFPHAADINGKTEINYEFFFYSGGSLTSPNNWQNSYLGEGFTTQDIFYYRNRFSNSFFKLDFYDSVDEKRQKNYFTIIIPTQQGEFMDINMARTPVRIRKPKYKLDYIGDKEGFFIYWLKSLKFLPLNTFYMTAKFYNASTGQFTKMMNEPQSSLATSSLGNNVYAFDNTIYFYYRVVLDYIDLSYNIFDIKTGTRVGTTTPIKWFEYVNPPRP